MGYELWVLPLDDGESPHTAAYRLMAAEEARAEADPDLEASKQRLAARIVETEPALHPAEREPADAFGEGFEALARAVEFRGWPGVRVRLHDESVAIDVATRPELATPDTAERLGRLVGVIAEASGWTATDGELDTVLPIAELVRNALARSEEMARMLAES